MNKKYIEKIIKTSIFISILISIQKLAFQFKNFILTGSLVNFVLAISLMSSGPFVSVLVSFFSPFLAKFFGIGPNYILIPFISLGNIIFVLTINAFEKILDKNKTSFIKIFFCLFVSSFIKSIFLNISILKFALPIFIKAKSEEVKKIAKMFSSTQFVTALVGSASAKFIFQTRFKKIKYERFNLKK